MNMHFEKTTLAQADCVIHSLSWMGKVPEEEVDEDGWRLNRSNYYQDGWLATGNAHGIVSVTFTTTHGRKVADLPQRANFNLRGHHSKVVLVRWNEPYQKLASCDSTGVIYVWIKFEGRWSVELINDRNTQVTDFAWSHDGRMALICYSDSYILVGSVSGQRFWSSVVNAGSAINCGIWSPDDKQVMFGTATGSILVIDVQGNIVGQLTILENIPIMSMSWSSEKFNMEEVEDFNGLHSSETNSGDSVLAVNFKNGLIYLMKSYDDLAPIIIETGLRGLKMEWSNSGDILAVAGHLQARSSVPYSNRIHFYRESGELCLSSSIPKVESPIAAITWGHNDKRLFVCVANQIYIGWITKKMPSLQLLSRIVLYQNLRDESSVKRLHLPHCLQTLVSNLFGPTIKCYLPDPNSLQEFVSTPPPHDIRLYCTMMRHEENSATNSMTYTLFLEYLGGLVPILKGKRASKLRPEFIIYDPHHPDDDMRKLAPFQTDLNHPSSNTHAACSSSSHEAPVSSSESEFEDSCASPRLQRPRRKKHGMARTRDWSVVAEREMFTDHLPEHRKIVAVSSNLWGTKFKIQGLVPWLPEILGTVTYRTSVLHLQPRQMTLVIKELQGPQFSHEASTLSLSNFSAMNLFPEEDDEAIEPETHETQACDETAAVAPMTPRRIPFFREGASFKLCRKHEYLSTTTVVDHEEEEYLWYFPSVNSFFRSSVTETGQRHQHVYTLVESHKAEFSYSNALPLDGGTSGQHATFEELYDILSQNLPDENSESQPASSASGAASPQRSYPVQGNDLFIATNLDCGASSPGSYSIFSPPLSVSPSSADNEIMNSNIPPDSSYGCSLSPPVKFGDSAEDKLSNGLGGNPLQTPLCDDSLKSELCCASSSSYIPSTSEAEANHDISNQKQKVVTVAGELKFIDDDGEEACCPCSSFESANLQFSRAIVNATNGELNPTRNRPFTSRDKERRVMFKTRKASADNMHCTECYGDEMIHEQLSSRQGEMLCQRNISYLCCSAQPHYSCVRNTCKSSHAQLKVNCAKDSTNSSLREKSSCSALCKENRASVPYVEKLRSSLNFSRSIPSSPETRRRNNSQKCSALYSPLLRRKMKNQMHNDSSDEEAVFSAEEIRTMEFKDLESFQKAYIKKKLKKWRGRTVADGLQNNSNAINYQEFVLHNKAPLWNEVSQVYQLDFGGRVTQESAKNFQIEFHGKQVMQFGRIDGHAYSLDFQYPFSALQAFSVALANVTQRLK